MCKAIIRIKNWTQSTAGKISVSLIVIGGILLFVACSDCCMRFMSEQGVENTNNILFGIATNLIGITVTVSFVQYLMDKENEKEEKEEEKKKILRYDRYMSTLIRKYSLMYLALTTRLDKRNSMDYEHPLNHDFSIYDMADMLKSSPYLTEAFSDPVVELFFAAEAELKEYALIMLENIDFKYQPELVSILLDFAEKSNNMNVSGQILEVCKKVKLRNDPTLVNTIERLLADESEDWVGMFERGELQNHLMIPYVILFFLLQEERKLLNEYMRCMENLYDH